MSTPAERLAEARHVLRDAWLEAGGCERCGGTGVFVQEDPWPDEKSLKPEGRFDPRHLFSTPTERIHAPVHPMLRRYPCDGDHAAGIDPSLGYDEIARCLRPSSVSPPDGHGRWVPMCIPLIEGQAGQTLTAVVQSFADFRGVKLVAVESDPGATSVNGWFVGAQNQMPMGYTGGIPTTCFAPSAQHNDLDLDVLRAGITMTLNIAFRRPCAWEGTLFGQIVMPRHLTAEQINTLADQR